MSRGVADSGFPETGATKCASWDCANARARVAEMNAKFLPSVAAIREGEVDALLAELSRSPALAADRSTCSHPTLMQCLALDGVDLPLATQRTMARALLERGSPIDEPLIACASVGNLVVGQFLIEAGACLDGRVDLIEGWSPLEEALYWGQQDMAAVLLARGARIRNLRTAAGLGQVEQTKRMAENIDQADVRASVHSPFGALGREGDAVEQEVLDNALVYAAMGGHCEVAETLCARGANAASFPAGFHYRGAPLHWAAHRGHQQTCRTLLTLGADPGARDLTIEKTAAEWAVHAGHEQLAAELSW